MLSARVGQHFKWVGQSPEWVGHGLPGLGLEPPLIGIPGSILIGLAYMTWSV